MDEDTETEVDMLRRHRSEAWGECGKWVGCSWASTISMLLMMALFVSTFWFGPQTWMLFVLLGTVATDFVANYFLQSHFSKKYMRLANGE